MEMPSFSTVVELVKVYLKLTMLVLCDQFQSDNLN